MKVSCVCVFHRGEEIPRKIRQSTPSIEGELDHREERINRIGRTVRVAKIKDPADPKLLSKLPLLVDAVIEYAVGDAMRIRGVEEEEGVLYGQCWDIRLI